MTDRPAFNAWASPQWDPDGVERTLEQIRCYVEERLATEIEWYRRSIRPKRFFSQSLRGGALGVSALGGLVPVLAAVNVLDSLRKWLNLSDTVKLDQLGYLFLAIAAALTLFDRYFGYSSSWMRCVTTMLALERHRERFRLEWLSLAHRLGGAPKDASPNAGVARKMLDCARRTLLDAKELTEKETEAWVNEFKSNLAQFEKDLKSQVDSAKFGAIDLKVHGAEQATEGLDFLLDQLLVERFIGSSSSVGNVLPGLHKVAISGKIGDRSVSASQMVNVLPGAISTCEFTLGTPEDVAAE